MWGRPGTGFDRHGTELNKLRTNTGQDGLKRSRPENWVGQTVHRMG